MISEPIQSPIASFIHQPVTIVERLALDALFKRSQPLHIELGSGDGSFLAKYAALHPELNFIGVERLLGRIRKLDKKGHKAGLTNLCLIRLEASYVLEFLLPKKQAAAVHVYFPDPWPKRKHHKNRLINTRFTEVAKEALQPGGTVFLRTDDADYFAQMTEVFGASPFFKLLETPAELCAVITDFERNFNARGVQTLRAAYVLKDV
jgi:tRNA (guanine-N7-)-methyltransferase